LGEFGHISKATQGDEYVAIRCPRAAVLCAIAFSGLATGGGSGRRPMSELTPTATIHIGKSADWVAVTSDAIWVGSTGPNAVSQINPITNKLVATVVVPGQPCAGLAVGFGSLWVPLCAKPRSLARVDLKTRAVTVLPGIGPAGPEAGIATSPDSVWMIVDDQGTLARIDPTSLTVRETVRVPAGSFNPLYSAGQLWVTRAGGAEVSVVDPQKNSVSATVASGPNPRFLAGGAGAVWTLNQGDGTLTRIDARTHKVTTTELKTPGKGGDIKVGGGIVWTTMEKVPLSAIDGTTGTLLCQWEGAGGDSLGISHGAIWLTDYDAGTVSRIEIGDAMHRCKGTG